MGMKIFCIIILALSKVFADDALQELQQGNIEFSSLLYQQVVQSTPGNIVISPLSVQLVLSLTKFGARGETASELSKALHLPDSPEKSKEAFKSLIPKLKGNQLYSLNSANKVYIKNGYTINPEFLKLAEEIFATELESIDFSQSSRAANIINKWVESKTNEKIKNVIPVNALDSATRLLLVNAIYFKGNWSSPFLSHGTKKRKFYKSGGQEVEVDTMFQSGNLKYSENKELDAKFVLLPYRGGDVTFTIAVPNQRDGLSSLEKNILQVLRSQKYSTERVNLYMPKFRIESTFNLIPPLEQLGIRKAFDSNEADFSGFLTSRESLVISNIIQKAFINVTETGTEAAAATAVGVSTTSIIIPERLIDLHVDRPFFYCINYQNFPIFLGRVTIPQI